jgi:hypothetical protein
MWRRFQYDRQLGGTVASNELETTWQMAVVA